MPTAIIEFTWPGIAWPQETLRCHEFQMYPNPREAKM